MRNLPPSTQSEDKMQQKFEQYARSRDEALRAELIKSQQGLVHHVLHQMKARLPVGMDWEDAISCGIAGLVEAIDRYDVTKGQFSTYACQRIAGSIRDGMTDYVWCRKREQRLYSKFQNYKSAEERLQGQDISDFELAEGMPLTDTQRHQLTMAILNSVPLPIDASVEMIEDPDPTPDMRMGDLSEKEALREAVLKLPDRERIILWDHYFESMSLSAIARREGWSVTTTSVHHAKGLDMVKKHLDY